MGVDMSDDSNGWIAGAEDGFGPICYRTSDGGETLVQTIDDVFEAPSIIMAVASLSNSSAAVAGLGAWFGLLGPGASYYDNGNWFPAAEMNYFAAAFQDSDTAQGVVFFPGYWYNNTFNEGCGVAVSYDGGRTYAKYDWGIQSIVGDYCEQARYGSFINSQVGYLSGGSWPVSSNKLIIGKENDVIHISQHVRIPHPHQDDLPADILQAFTGRFQQAAGYRAVVAKTVDGGVTWNTVNDIQDGDYYYNAISFTNETHGCVVGEGVDGASIFCTTNGGVDFTVRWTDPIASLMALDFADANNGWAAGMWINGGVQALFLQTTNGGITWNSINADFAPGHLIASISMADAHHGNAVALNLASLSSSLRYD